MNWNDLEAFLAVARASGLSGAAQALGSSPATLGRHMDRLESDIGQVLFVRSATGYTLTAAGQALYSRAQGMAQAALSVERWRDGVVDEPALRLAVDDWMGAYLATVWGQLNLAEDAFHLAFVAPGQAADLVVRSARPVEQTLTSRSAGQVAYAPYVQAGTQPTGWIAQSPDTSVGQWVEANGADAILVEADSLHLAIALCEQGVGAAVLPCFLGDENARLARAGGTISVLSHTLWIATLNEGDNLAAAQKVARRIEALLEDSASLFKGEKG